MKVFQIRQDDRFAWYETSKEHMEDMVNKCNWQGRVLELAKDDSAQPVQQPAPVDGTDSIELCVSDIKNSIIFDTPRDQVTCIRAVTARLFAIMDAAPVAAPVTGQEPTKAMLAAGWECMPKEGEARSSMDYVYYIYMAMQRAAPVPAASVQPELSADEADALHAALVQKLEGHRMVHMFDVEEGGGLGNSHHLIDRLSLEGADISGADVSHGKDEIISIIDSVFSGAKEYAMSIIAKRIHDRACTCQECLKEFSNVEPDSGRDAALEESAQHLERMAKDCGSVSTTLALEYAATDIRALAAHPASVAQVGELSHDSIQQIFLASGFTIKEGQSDLKDYVYKAAYAILAAAKKEA